MTDKTKRLAVIASGGKQYLVEEGQTIRVEKLDVGEGDAITFDQVLLTTRGDKTTVGTPLVAKAKVEAKVIKHGRDEKVFGVKFKAKKRYKRVFGHKQHHTQIEISKITV